MKAKQVKRAEDAAEAVRRANRVKEKAAKASVEPSARGKVDWNEIVERKRRAEKLRLKREGRGQGSTALPR